MDFTFNNSSIVSVNSGTIVLNVSGKTKTFVDAKLISAVDGKIVLELPSFKLTKGAYVTIHLVCAKRIQRTFISNTDNNYNVTYHVTQFEQGIKFVGDWGHSGILRNATPEEVQELNEQLAAEGKVWNPDTMQIEKLRWKPKKRNKYYYVRSKGNVNSAFWHKGSVDIHRYKFGNCFQTKDEAEAKLTQIKQILNSTI